MESSKSDLITLQIRSEDSHPVEAITGAITVADRHPVLVYLGSLSPGSRRTMMQSLNWIARTVSGGRCDALGLNWGALHYQHTQGIRSRITERFAVATSNKLLSSLRGVLRESWRLGQISAEDYHRAVDLKPVRGQMLPRGRALSMEELRALFRVCAADQGPAGMRDAAILAVLFGAGLRRSEVVALDLADFESETGALTVHAGKGKKDRIAYAANGSLHALGEWLSVRGDRPGPLFFPVHRTGRILLRRLSPQAIYHVLRQRAIEASVKPFSPHDCRRSFVSALLDLGADVVSVQHLAGHSSVATTARYDRRGEVSKKRAAELLFVPFAERPSDLTSLRSEEDTRKNPETCNNEADNLPLPL